MAVPNFQTMMLPLLRLANDGQQHTPAEAVERLTKELQLDGTRTPGEKLIDALDQYFKGHR